MLDRFESVFGNVEFILMSLAYVILFSYHIWNILAKGQHVDVSYFLKSFLVILFIAYLPAMYSGLASLAKSLGDSLQPQDTKDTFEFFQEYNSDADGYSAKADWNDIDIKCSYLVWVAEYNIVYTLHRAFDILVTFFAKFFAPVAGFLVVVGHFPSLRGKAVTTVLFFCQVVLWPIGWGLCEALMNVVNPANDAYLTTMSRLAFYGTIRVVWMVLFVIYVPRFFFLLFTAASVSGALSNTLGSAAGSIRTKAANIGRGTANLADNATGGRASAAYRRIRSVTQQNYEQRQSLRRGKVIVFPEKPIQTLAQQKKMPAVRN